MISLLRVKNESRWLKRCIESILPISEKILVMDDHSEDGTLEICNSIRGVEVLCSPFTGLNETRDKQWLLERAGKTDVILFIDGDEMLTAASIPAIQYALTTSERCWSFSVKYLWDRDNQVRVDGVYGRFGRPSMFRPNGSSFQSTGAGGNFHCGNAPWALQQVSVPINASLLHFGYMLKEDRVRKYAFYNSTDPNNLAEDGYRHMVIGDIFPADSRFKHGGPLRLKSL